MRNLTEIAMALIGVSILTLLVGHADDASKVIKAGTQGFGGLLSIVTLQNQYGNSWSN